jgi:hypothetical protein
VDGQTWLAVIVAFLGGGTIGALVSANYARTQDFRHRMLAAADEFMVTYSSASETLVDAMSAARELDTARTAAEGAHETVVGLVEPLLREADEPDTPYGAHPPEAEDLRPALQQVGTWIRGMRRFRFGRRDDEYDARRAALDTALDKLLQTDWFARSEQGRAFITVVERMDDLEVATHRRRALQQRADALTYELTARVGRLIILFAGGDSETDVSATAASASKDLIQGFQVLADQSGPIDERIRAATDRLTGGSASSGHFARQVNRRVRRHFL